VLSQALAVSNYVEKEAMMTDKAEKRVTLRIPPGLHDMLLEAAYQSKKSGEGKSINQIGIEALEMWLKTYGTSDANTRANRPL